MKELKITKGECEKYQRKELAELRPVTEVDIEWYNAKNVPERWEMKLSVSKADRDNGSPKIGDMIARNPKNHYDQWLVAEQYFKDNFATPEQTNSELLERYNEAIEVLEEVNKDLIVLHGNIYQELKKGNSQWEGVDEIIFKRIEANKQTISKANGK